MWKIFVILFVLVAGTCSLENKGLAAKKPIHRKGAELRRLEMQVLNDVKKPEQVSNQIPLIPGQHRQRHMRRRINRFRYTSFKCPIGMRADRHGNCRDPWN